MTLIDKIFKSKNMVNSMWIVGQQFFQMAMQFVVSIFIVRYLGPSDYGVISYTTCYIGFFMSIVTLGMDSIVIKKMIEYPDDEGEILGGCITYRLFAALFSSISVIILIFVINPGDMVKLTVIACQSLQFFFRSFQLIDTWFQRYLLSKYSSYGKTIACVAVSAYKIVLLVTAKSVIWFAIADSIMEFVIVLFEYVIYTKKFKRKIKPNKTWGLKVLKESYNFIIAGVMVSIYSQIDKIMIGNMLSDYDVGQYTASANICSIALLIPAAFITSFQPTIVERKKDGEDEYQLLIKKVHSGIIWLSIIMSLAISLFSGLIIRFIYGADYITAASTLRIAIWFQALSIIGSLRSVWLLCEEKTDYLKAFVCIGVFVNVTLNYILIPQIGINGAAIATIITELVTSFFASLLFKGTRKHAKLVLDSIVCRW